MSADEVSRNASPECPSGVFQEAMPPVYHQAIDRQGATSIVTP